MTSAYGIAQRELDGVRMLGGLSGKKPNGFERTQNAVENYLSNMRQRYETASEMVNDPSPKHNVAFTAAQGPDYGTHFVGTILKAYDDDLRDAGFTGDLRARLRARIRGG